MSTKKLIAEAKKKYAASAKKKPPKPKPVEPDTESEPDEPEPIEDAEDEVDISTFLQDKIQPKPAEPVEQVEPAEEAEPKLLPPKPKRKVGRPRKYEVIKKPIDPNAPVPLKPEEKTEKTVNDLVGVMSYMKELASYMKSMKEEQDQLKKQITAKDNDKFLLEKKKIEDAISEARSYFNQFSR